MIDVLAGTRPVDAGAEVDGAWVASYGQCAGARDAPADGSTGYEASAQRECLKGQRC